MTKVHNFPKIKNKKSQKKTKKKLIQNKTKKIKAF